MADIEHHTLSAREQELDARDLLTNSIKSRFERVLQGFREGQLTLTWPDGSSAVFGDRESAAIHANVVLHNYQPLRRLITDGQIGFAESYKIGRAHV